jgi:hypothetical protein
MALGISGVALALPGLIQVTLSHNFIDNFDLQKHSVNMDNRSA